MNKDSLRETVLFLRGAQAALSTHLIGQITSNAYITSRAQLSIVDHDDRLLQRYHQYNIMDWDKDSSLKDMAIPEVDKFLTALQKTLHATEGDLVIRVPLTCVRICLCGDTAYYKQYDDHEGTVRDERSKPAPHIVQESVMVYDKTPGQMRYVESECLVIIEVWCALARLTDTPQGSDIEQLIGPCE